MADGDGPRSRTPPRAKTPLRAVTNAGGCCSRPASYATAMHDVPAAAPLGSPSLAAAEPEKYRSMGLGALSRYATGLGVGEEALHAAQDMADPRRALICLILDQPSSDTLAQQREQQLRTELQGLALSSLSRRATAEEGIGAAAVDEALDSSEPMASLIELIVVAASHRRRHAPPTTAAPAANTSGDGAQQQQQQQQQLRADLGGLGLSVLGRRAAAVVSAQDADAAMDADDPKGTLIELIVAAVATEARPSGEYRREALRQELDGMRLMALHERAREEGVDSGVLDDLLDGAEPKRALVELLLGVCGGGAAAASAPEQDEGGGGRLAAVRQELLGLRVAALHALAQAEEGVEAAAVDAALDSPAPKDRLIELLVEHRAGADAAPGRETGAGAAALRAELEAMRASALHQRAQAIGAIDADAIADAMDAEGGAKDALIRLIVDSNRQSQSSSATPHFGSRAPRQAGPAAAPPETAAETAPAPAPQPAGRELPVGQHVMLSYEWSHQAQVKRAYDLLTRRGVRCWMDITGGMSSDIYDSMAAGVSNACVVVCFMSQAYQDSQNCMLECKYAKQMGIEIVPVLMQGQWKATGWLGLLTAGALWIPLHDESSFDTNVKSLQAQVQMLVGNTTVDVRTLTEEGIVDAAEAKEELARLRDDLVQSKPGQQALVVAVTDPSQPAAVPAGVPQLPPRFQSTEQIHELTRLVLSTSEADIAKPRVGFYGMGGIGKTVTGAAIARNEGVRKHFHIIVWVPLGQTPVVAKLQNLCAMQCTGKELSAELSVEEKQQALQQAMSGKRVLLCLDVSMWLCLDVTLPGCDFPCV
jgi:hypothetical protein